MKDLILQELGITECTVEEITGLGTVNQVYAIKAPEGEFILRLNDEADKAIEYRKETWCIDAVSNLGIPSPKVLNTGVFKETVYMLQQKIPGINGSNAKVGAKLGIWRDLGTYAKKFQRIPRIAATKIEENEFHASWKHRLNYNIESLNKADSLLKNEAVSNQEHAAMKALLFKLDGKEFTTGLVHGDLCPRNTIWKKGNTFLIDWGTAEINIVPHVEIGITLLSGEADREEFAAFLQGLELDNTQFKSIEPDVRIINFLHHLDKYRWAEDHAIENIGGYEKMVLSTFRQAI